MSQQYEFYGEGQHVVKAWVRGVPFEQRAQEQVLNVARLPCIYKWVAVMLDVHAGIGAIERWRY